MNRASKNRHYSHRAIHVKIFRNNCTENLSTCAKYHHLHALIIGTIVALNTRCAGSRPANKQATAKESGLHEGKKCDPCNHYSHGLGTVCAGKAVSQYISNA